MDLIRILFVLLLLAAGHAAHAVPSLLVNNKQATTDQVVPPTPLTLGNGWWKYVDITHEDLAERTENMKNAIRFSLDTISPSKMSEFKGLFKNISQTLDAIAAINKSDAVINESVITLPAEYSISEFQALFDRYHQAKARRNQLISLQAEEEKIARQAERKASDVFQEYREIKEKNQEKLALGLVVMANRLSWYLWKLNVSSKQQEIIAATEKQEDILQRIDEAIYLLDVDKKSYSQLISSIEEQEKELEKLEGKVVVAQYRFTGEIGLDFMSRLQEELYAQQIIIARLDAQKVNLQLANLQAIESIILLNNPVLADQVADFNHVDNLRQINQLRKTINESAGLWREQTENERTVIQELLASGSIAADNKAAREIIEERVGTIQITLQSISQLENLTFNLDFLGTSLEKQLGESRGWWFKLKTSGRHVVDQTFVRSWNLLFVRLFDIGDVPVTSWDIIQALLVLIIAYYLAGTFRKLLLRLNTNADGKVPPAMYTLSRLVFYLMIVFGIIAAFSSIGVQFTNIAIVAGALSVGIGFGLQSIVNNFVSGIIILFEQNIKVGDFVELDTGLKGTVRDINVRSTIVNTLDNLDIIVPNSELVAAKVTNYTLNEPIVRIHVPFGVAYGSDKELVKKAVLEAARKVEITYDDGANRRTSVWLVGFGDSSLDFELVVWLNPKSGKTTPGSWRSLFNWEIETALAKYGIQIPFPQRDLHVKSGLLMHDADKKELL